MKIMHTHLEGCLLIEPKVIYDDRGYFMESFNERQFHNETGIDVHFVQDNRSYSTKGVLRGLHYQTGEFAQAKLVSVLDGEILDVAVDIRPESKTYGQYSSVILSGDNKRQFFIPRGFAHGFVVVSDTATVFYKCDNYYNKEHETGILFSDQMLNINWQIPVEQLIISEKDKNQPEFSKALKIW
ncbi:dTDP-4-dehydrorhamnose 3,5-epimerase [Flavobacterium sp. MK4S-17]|uniref:dTDP-4-dehydrorhamnose 3,5-epimerase n=1 Tax=Flavobacterium sp. MK4S-17 TaxID=2543737 RepID=UPI00135A3A42|nr:dTDP-4-dehydrorhamnose 3,5-epimerase [Flavobacterium sp. MK4S-17]